MRKVIGDADHVSAVHVDDALGTPRGAAGVEDEERILGVHLLRGRFGGELEQIVIVDLADCLWLVALRASGDNDDVLDRVQAVDSFIDDGFERHGLAAADA